MSIETKLGLMTITQFILIAWCWRSELRIKKLEERRTPSAVSIYVDARGDDE